MILFLPETQKLLIKRKELLAKRLQFCFKTLGTYTMILLLRLDTGFIQRTSSATDTLGTIGLVVTGPIGGLLSWRVVQLKSLLLLRLP